MVQLYFFPESIRQKRAVDRENFVTRCLVASLLSTRVWISSQPKYNFNVLQGNKRGSNFSPQYGSSTKKMLDHILTWFRSSKPSLPGKCLHLLNHTPPLLLSSLQSQVELSLVNWPLPISNIHLELSEHKWTALQLFTSHLCVLMCVVLSGLTSPLYRQINTRFFFTQIKNLMHNIYWIYKKAQIMKNLL